MARKPRPAKAKSEAAQTVSTDAQQDQPKTEEAEHSAAHLFKPGQSGNPAGRPKGSRNKLGEAFIQAMYADFTDHGPDVIERVRIEKPDQYLKVVASILPQQLNVKVSEWDELTDDQLDQRIASIARALELEIGAGKASRREAAPQTGKPLN